MELEDNFREKLHSILDLLSEKSEDENLNLQDKLFQNVTGNARKNHPAFYSITRDVIKNMRSSCHYQLIDYIVTLKEDSNSLNCNKIYDVAYELRDIFPSVVEKFVLSFALEQLKAEDIDNRMSSTYFMGKYMFEFFDFVLERKLKYFVSFLGQLRDVDNEVRLIASRYVKKIFLNHSRSRKIIVNELKLLKNNYPMEIKIVAIALMTNLIIKEIEILNEKFFSDYVMDLRTDSQFSVREWEMKSMGYIFKKHIENIQHLSPKIREILQNIPSKLLHNFATNKNVLDAMLIEEIFRESLVSFELPVDVRMKRIFRLYSTLHPLVLNQFEYLLLGEKEGKKLLSNWVKLIKEPNFREGIMNNFNQIILRKNSLMTSMTIVDRFEKYLQNEKRLLNNMEIIVDPNVSCEDAIEAFNTSKTILELSKSKYSDIFIGIIERGTSFIFDNESIKVLIDYVLEIFNDKSIANELYLDSVCAQERGIKLLQVLSNCFPGIFQEEEIVERLIDCLERDSKMLLLITNIGKQKKIEDIIKSDSKLDNLISFCMNLSIEGTQDEAREAIECIINATSNYHIIFDEILRNMISNSTLSNCSKFYLTSVVSLNDIVIARPTGECLNVEDLIQQVFEFITKRGSSGIVRDEGKLWCDENELSLMEKCYEKSIICIAHWIYGVKSNSQDFQFFAKQFLELVKRHFFEPFSNLEAKRNRLRAISAIMILELCEIPEFRDSLSGKFYQQLAMMINDECIEVSKYFIRSLIKLLEKNSTYHFLSNEFLAFFILLQEEETDFVKYARECFENIIKKRDIFVQYLLEKTEGDIARQMEFSESLVSYTPEFSVIHGMSLLVNDPDLKDANDLNTTDIKNIHDRLWTFMQPIVEKSCFNCVDLFQRIGDKLEDVGDPNSLNVTEKLWAVKEILLTIVDKRIKNFEDKMIFPGEIKIPKNYVFETCDEEST